MRWRFSLISLVLLTHARLLAQGRGSMEVGFYHSAWSRPAGASSGASLAIFVTNYAAVETGQAIGVKRGTPTPEETDAALFLALPIFSFLRAHAGVGAAAPLNGAIATDVFELI